MQVQHSPSNCRYNYKCEYQYVNTEIQYQKSHLERGGIFLYDCKYKEATATKIPPPNPATAKQEPEMSRPLWGKVAGVSLTEGGNSLSTQTAPQPRHLSQRLQSRSLEKAVPLGGRWRRQATEGGNSLSILDCSTTSPPNPTHHANKPHQIRGAIQYRKRASPLRALTGATSPQRARLIL